MDKVKITDEFYLEKFMELQRANIVLWRRLKTLEQEKNIREIIETLVDENFFNGLDDLVK
tara:strand:+ start:3286 stop:3465 length:180 start_codon:yes stop_codon:yes gene_type:complete